MDSHRLIEKLLTECMAFDIEMANLEGHKIPWETGGEKHRHAVLITALFAEKSRMKEEVQHARDRHSARVN